MTHQPPPGHVALRCQLSTCSREFLHVRQRGRHPRYCSVNHRKQARAAYKAARERSYERCSRCSKVAELVWGKSKEFCSAMCFGVAALLAQGVPESAAERRIAETLGNDPILASRSFPGLRKWTPEEWERWGYTDRSLNKLDAYEMVDGFHVNKQETYLGGDLGPYEGRTAPSATGPRLKGDPEAEAWLESHKDWWKDL